MPRKLPVLLSSLTALALAGGLAACGGGSSKITLSDAKVRMPSSPDVTGGYVTIRNDGDQADKLVGASTTAAREVQIHEMINQGGQMKMHQIQTLAIPAHQTVMLKPGGYHLMLMGPKDLQVGKSVRIELKFDKAGTKTVDAQVVSLAPGMGGSMGTPGASPAMTSGAHTHP